MTERRLTRRRYLAVASAVGVAGCAGQSNDDGGSTPAPTDDGGTATPTEDGTATPAPTTEPTTEPPTDGPYGGWLADTDNFDGTRDLVGESSVTVAVGAEGNGGDLAFAPAAIRISQGATVTWEWVAGRHNVAVESQPDGAAWTGQPEQIADPGFTYEHVFETPGTYLYYCTPHLQMGMKGVVVVDESSGVGGGSGTETA